MAILISFWLAVTVLDFTNCIMNVPIHRIEALTGETIYLPCNVSTYDDDEIVLILWYREDMDTPIYSVDIREGFVETARRWSDETIFAGRAYFLFDKVPGALSIKSVQYSDSGTYRCRVDFLKAQTRNSKVYLSVFAPPKRIIIRDESDTERSTVIGPYNEGDIISLKCEVFGGKPIPNINWYRDGVEVESEMNHMQGETYVQSTIFIGPLQRGDLNSRIVCRAINHPRAIPLEAVVQVDMNFAPLNIKLLGAHQPLSAGRRYDLLCQSAGSRPPAIITWWQNGVRLEKTVETTSSDGNQTTSTLSISFTKADAGKLLSCKAHNHAIQSEYLEDGWKLDIQYIPEAYVRLGTSLDQNAIREGTDVYFDCLIVAHPLVYRVEWLHNEKPLPRNISQGVIISNYSLVLQGVSRATAGNYSCIGFNTEGEGISPPFLLNILYVPKCISSEPRVYGVAKLENAKIKCLVDANPPDVEFSWTFNNSAESINVATNRISISGTISTVTYTPTTELDYGTLLCIASNKIGRQRVPCVFHIIAAGRPDQVHNCTLTNVSMTSLTVTCINGFNGGLPQLFILELIDSHSNEIKANITSAIPRFTVSTLVPGNTYILSVYAFNSKGKSDPKILSAAMLRMPEKQHTSEPVNKSRAEYLYSPMISLTVGLTLTITVAVLAVVLALRIPCSNSNSHRKELTNRNELQNESPCQSVKSFQNKEFDENDSDERNPDVVPEIINSDDQVDFIRKKQHISTIESNCSPSKRSIIMTPLEKYDKTEVASHGIGYCTISNGRQSVSTVGAFSMNVKPHIYSNSTTQCTLPRRSHQQMWSGYNGALKTVRHVQPVAPLQELPHQTLTYSPPKEPLPLYPEVTSPSTPINLLTVERTNSQQINQNEKICLKKNNIMPTFEPICLSDDEITIQNPLLKKCESKV